MNQYGGAGPATFSYDANGNLTSDGTHYYAYDIENRLILTSNGTSLGYDPQGRLQQVSRNGVVTQFVYAGDALVAEYDASGAMTRRYLHGQGADTPLVMFPGSSMASPHYL